LAISIESKHHRSAIVRRLRRDLSHGRLITAAAASFEPDVILTHAPLIAQWRLQRWTRRHGVRVVYWLQDMISMTMSRKLRARTGGFGRPGAWMLRRLEGDVLRASDHVVAVSPGFLRQLANYGVRDDAVSVIPNWAPLDEIQPAPRTNAWAVENGLADRLVFLYAGGIGMHDNPAIMVELAVAQPGIAVVIVSEGWGADYIRAEAARRGLLNLRVFPFQPYSLLPEVLATGDVLMVILAARAAAYAVPSKVLSYLCARRPVLASMPAENLSAETLVKSGGGVVARAGDDADWLDKAAQLAADPELRARMADAGWQYAQDNFDIGPIADQFEHALAGATTITAT
jgi:colanic acid biosynthesis glycosyl transferase WcaI